MTDRHEGDPPVVSDDKEVTEEDWEELDRLVRSTIVARKQLSPENLAAQKGYQATKRRFMIFRASGRRFSFYLDRIVTIGRIHPRSWLTGQTNTQKGIFRLKDIKAYIGTAGAAGGVYIVVRSDNGAQVAWAVDGIERVTPEGITKIRRFEAFSKYSRNNVLIEGLIYPPGDQSPHGQKPRINLVDINVLMNHPTEKLQANRALRR